jgi:hypothetical protein
MELEVAQQVEIYAWFAQAFRQAIKRAILLATLQYVQYGLYS